MRSPGAPERPVEAGFERRAARAEALAQESRTAEEPLRFAAGLYRAQGRLATAVETAHARNALCGQLERDLDGFQDALTHLLQFAA